MTDKMIHKGFIIAGLSNILGVIICSKALTNDVMLATQPDVMGYFGLISIILWGLAYISVCKSYNQARWLVGVFAIEKLVYVIVWLAFITSHSLSAIYEQDVLAGAFYTIYGANDFIFMLFFSFVFLRLGHVQTKTLG
ncbi:hypothetical protein [Sphingorhabdus sp.]|uniref:hypothetical protein n=1 Tax=Sphingorhabdus sp. TaxID=1902408 RepID=UPI003983500B